jgi:hypothetical protein
MSEWRELKIMTINKNDLNELVDFLKANLFIYIEQNTEFGPVEEIKVTIELCGDVISESSCSLPSQG